jgi:hypothetical protein
MQQDTETQQPARNKQSAVLFNPKDGSSNIYVNELTQKPYQSASASAIYSVQWEDQ